MELGRHLWIGEGLSLARRTPGCKSPSSHGRPTTMGHWGWGKLYLGGCARCAEGRRWIAGLSALRHPAILPAFRSLHNPSTYLIVFLPSPTTVSGKRLTASQHTPLSVQRPPISVQQGRNVQPMARDYRILIMPAHRPAVETIYF